MEAHCKDHRGVVEYRYDVATTLSGVLYVQVSHRHYGGDWSHWKDIYTRLSHAELLDVIEAKNSSLNYRHPWLNQIQGTMF